MIAKALVAVLLAVALMDQSSAARPIPETEEAITIDKCYTFLKMLPSAVDIFFTEQGDFLISEIEKAAASYLVGPYLVTIMAEFQACLDQVTGSTKEEKIASFRSCIHPEHQ